MAPLQRREQRLLAGGRRPGVGAQQPETVIQALCERARAEAPEACGGQLQRERQAVEPEADTRHVARVLVVHREPGDGRGGAVGQQPHGLVARQLLRGVAALGIGDRQRGHAEHDLPVGAQRLAGRRQDRQSRRPAQQLVAEGRTGGEQVLAVVEHEQRRSWSEELHDALKRRAPGHRGHLERRRGGVHDEASLLDAGELDERGAVGIVALAATCQLEGQPCLARAAGAGEREQARGAQQRGQLAELVLAPDERARARRERPDRGPPGDQLSELLLELAAQLLELFASHRRPVLVAVLGQQLTGVDGQRRAVGVRRARFAGVCGRVLELVHVDGRVQRQQLLPQLDRVGSEDPAGRMHDLVEVVRRRGRLAVWPQRVHQLLPVHTVPRREGQHLDQVACLAQAPACVLGRLARRRLGSEAAEQFDRDLAGRGELGCAC